MEGIHTPGVGSLWPKATTRGLQMAQGYPGPRRAPVSVSQGTQSHWAGKLILTHKKFGIRADSSQNKNIWLNMNCKLQKKKQKN